MRLAWLGIAALGLASSAQASNWVMVTQGADHTQYYVDAASSVHTGTKWNFWLKGVQPKTTAPQRISYVLSRWDLDCVASTIKVLQTTQYSPTGNIVGDWTASSYAQADAINPDSIGDDIKKIICTVGEPAP